MAKKRVVSKPYTREEWAVIRAALDLYKSATLGHPLLVFNTSKEMNDYRQLIWRLYNEATDYGIEAGKGGNDGNRE